MNLKNNKIIAAIKLIKKAYGKYTKHLVILAILGFIGGFLEAIGINAIIPLFSIMTEGQSSDNNVISQFINSIFNFLKIELDILPLLLFIAILFISKFILLLAFKYVRARIISSYESSVRSDLFSETMSTNWSYLMHQKSGYLEKTIMVDVENGKHLMSYLTDLILLATSLLIYVVVAISISVKITLITLIVGATLFLVFKKLIHKTKIIAAQEEQTMKNVASFINENVYGMKVIKTLPIKNQVISKANKFFQKFRLLQVKRLFLADINSQSIQLIGMLFILAVFYFTYQTDEKFNFATFAVIIYIVQKIFIYVQSGQNKLHNINAVAPYLQNVLKYQEALKQNKEEMSGTKEFKFNDKLSFNNIKFGYSKDENIIDFSNNKLSINKGEMIGLIGPSGAGKTTLVDLLLRLFKPNEGNITLDNININEIDQKQWQENIGYVSQDIFLINDTIENNIKFYEDISDDDMIEAAKAAHIYEFTQGLPDKFQTIIGERGMRLSGGQRQRIILARTLSKKPKILILDEATSALDGESEVLIQKAIDELRGKITVLAIAHRLSTIMNSDKIVVLEGGKITEQGTPKELLENKKSYFYKIYNIRKDTND